MLPEWAGDQSLAPEVRAASVVRRTHSSASNSKSRDPDSSVVWKMTLNLHLDVFVGPGGEDAGLGLYSLRRLQLRRTENQNWPEQRAQLLADTVILEGEGASELTGPQARGCHGGRLSSVLHWP